MTDIIEKIKDTGLHKASNRDLFEQAKSYAYAYMDTLHDHPVFPTEESIARLDIFDEKLQDVPSDPLELLRLLHEYGSPTTVAQSGGRYFGFVCGSIFPVAVAAKWLSDTWDQNCGLYVMSPIASKLESVCEQWLIDILELPAGTVAGFVSGTSTAILCGLAAGRNELLKQLKWDINLKGLFGAPNIRIVLGEQAHASVIKALALLGFGKEQMQLVPVDAQGRMIADQMPELDNKTIVIAQAGNVNSGAFDPFDKICDLASHTGAWVHIDGAFGLWAAASRNKKVLTRGFEMADSWSVDAHKTLNAPYDCGIVLCKNRDVLVSAMQAKASYIQYSPQRDGMLYTPEMSRRARSIELWATMKFLGKRGIEELINGLCDQALQFAELLNAKGFHILNDVVFNQILVSCDTPEETSATLKNIQQAGTCWCGGTMWKGEPAIRISVCSWTTTLADIELSAEAFVKAWKIAKTDKE